MKQLAALTVSSLWPMMGELGPLRTPSQRFSFAVESVTPERVKVQAGQTGLVILKVAFEAALEYLHANDHHAGNPCVIESDNDHEEAGPLCKASRQLPSGRYGQRNITYVLPILEQLGVVGISPKRPTSVWLTNRPMAVVTDCQPRKKQLIDSTHPGLLTPNQLAFANHLVELWGGAPGSFEHRYKTSKHHSWNPWKERAQGDDWWCLTLAQAAEHYSWPEKLAPEDFASIASRLRQALAANDHIAAQTACEDVFNWGGVARREDDASLMWVKAQAAAKTLCRSILTAVELLRPECTASLKAFDGKNLLMNSAMTKIYAAADPDNIIIYDGRVGAALGLLARLWLSENGLRVVPADLAFRWGPNTKTANNKTETRDPSRDKFEFVSLYKASTLAANQTEYWAGLVRITNRILQEVRSVLAAQGRVVTLLKLERALFMIGYDVR
ncbi:hypothetical protein [Pseudomonas akapageensis]|uniref:hypothetical protein n=1 Tax=Pseudomonas akapageensis TaxID=2609961 RepID=UPI00140E3FD2|nr:hypothetical protein [Pseudomonas akapageensis]